MTDKARIRNSPNFRNGAFQNLSPTPLMAENSSYLKAIGESLHRPKTVRPPRPLPSQRSDISQRSQTPVITWFGHSSYLIQAGNKNILVDPVFSGHASPLSWLIRAFPGADIYSAKDFPDIDMLIITHNHFDHLDNSTIRALAPKIRSVYTTLGTGRDIPLDQQIITELDWWETLRIDDGTSLTALPARHFSGRSIKRNLTLWASFFLEIAGSRIYIGGDSGYDGHFKEIGERFGPFDIAILECGQYNESWKYIHMMPEQTAQAAVDLKAKVLMPVHWAKFTLANHPWDEPIRRVTRAAREMHLKITTPMIGEQVIVGEKYPSGQWWVF